MSGYDDIGNIISAYDREKIGKSFAELSATWQNPRPTVVTEVYDAYGTMMTAYHYSRIDCAMRDARIAELEAVIKVMQSFGHNALNEAATFVKRSRARLERDDE